MILMKAMKLFTGKNYTHAHPCWLLCFDVLHSYEIQLEPEVRRKGLGKFLMQILELIGHRYGDVGCWLFIENTLYFIHFL